MSEYCKLYLISPLDVGGDFPERLKRALEAAADDGCCGSLSVSCEGHGSA